MRHERYLHTNQTDGGQAAQTTCKWTHLMRNDRSNVDLVLPVGDWVTACHRSFTLNGTPYENRFDYCPGCGRELTTI